MPLPVANTNDGNGGKPNLRCYMSWLALDQMPQFASPAADSDASRVHAIATAGYQGIQLDVEYSAAQVDLCRKAGLRVAGSGRVNRSSEIRAVAERALERGLDGVTLHVGWGMEDEAAGLRLLEGVIHTSEQLRIPLFVETHRATIFQDIWRTVQFVKRLPAIRINGDFSHWYTGLEFVYGGFETKMQFIAPVLERVRFLHGRIGNPGSMQVDIGGGDEAAQPFVTHFRQLWIASMIRFLENAGPGDFLCFVPELLAPRINYGRAFRAPNGELVDESDRWAQSKILCELARGCFDAALHTIKSGTPN
jgi:hypothetical protein